MVALAFHGFVETPIRVQNTNIFIDVTEKTLMKENVWQKNISDRSESPSSNAKDNESQRLNTFRKTQELKVRHKVKTWRLHWQ